MSDIDNDLKRRDRSLYKGSSQGSTSYNASGLDRSSGSGASRIGFSGSSDRVSEVNKRRKNFESYINSIISGSLDIKDRNQIINPEDLLSDFWDYYSDTTENRALYNQYLEALRNFQSQQEAAYQEFYNSPNQQTLRDQLAGLNTDILGISGSSPSSSAHIGSSNPFNGLPTSEELSFQQQQIKLQKFSNIVQALSSVSSLASAFTSVAKLPSELAINKQQLDNLKLQGESLDLSNESTFGSLLASDISDLLGTAQNAHLRSGSSEPFNLDQWFANDENFAPLSAVYGNNPRFASQLTKQRNAVLQHMTKASQMQKDLSSNIYDTAEIISSPYYSDDQKITMIQLRPFTAACAEAEKAEVTLRKTLADIRNDYSSGLNIQTAIDVANNQNKYQSDYYSEANGKYVAAFEQYLRDVSKPAYELERSINQGYLDMFNSDPSGSGAWKAAYLFGSKGGTSWKEAYLIRNDEFFGTFIDSEIELAKTSGDFARLSALAHVLQNFTPNLENPDINFVRNYKNYYEKIEKVLKSMGEDIDIIK